MQIRWRGSRLVITLVDNFDGRTEATNDYSLHTQIAPACRLFHSKPTMTPFRSIHKQNGVSRYIVGVTSLYVNYVKIICKSTLRPSGTYTSDCSSSPPRIHPHELCRPVLLHSYAYDSIIIDWSGNMILTTVPFQNLEN